MLKGPAHIPVSLEIVSCHSSSGGLECRNADVFFYMGKQRSVSHGPMTLFAGDSAGNWFSGWELDLRLQHWLAQGLKQKHTSVLKLNACKEITCCKREISGCD